MNFNKRRGFLLIILMITFLLIATACDTLLPFEVNDDIDESGATAVESNGEETSESRETEHTHNWKPATCSTPKKCSKCGTTSGSAAGHSWQAATCSSPKKCSKCGTTSGSAAGHSWQAATCSSPKTCSKCGTTSGTPLGHTWSGKTCSVCSATISMYSGTKAPDFGYALKTYVSPTAITSSMYFYDNFTLNANDEPSDCFEIYDNLLSACGYTLRDSFETDYGDTVLMYYNSSYNCVGVSVTTMPDMEGIMIYVT